MQNLALSSQFGNNGRRGNSSSNSFNSLVLNGVLPPSEDGRVEAIQMHDPGKKTSKKWREDSPLEPGGWYDSDPNPFDAEHGGGGLDPGTGGGSTGGGTTGGKGAGGDAGSNGNYQNYSTTWRGWSYFLNIGLPGVGVFMPSDEYWEQKAREEYINRVLSNVMNLFDNPHYKDAVLNIVLQNLKNILLALGIDPNYFDFVLRELLNQTSNAINYPDQNLVNKVKDYIKSGEFRNNSNIPDFMRDPNFHRDKVDFTLFEPMSFTHLPGGGLKNTAFGFLITSITIKMKLVVKDGKPYMKIFAEISIIDNYGKTLTKTPELYEELLY